MVDIPRTLTELFDTACLHLLNVIIRIWNNMMIRRGGGGAGRIYFAPGRIAAACPIKPCANVVVAAAAALCHLQKNKELMNDIISNSKLKNGFGAALTAISPTKRPQSPDHPNPALPITEVSSRWHQLSAAHVQGRCGIFGCRNNHFYRFAVPWPSHA